MITTGSKKGDYGEDRTKMSQKLSLQLIGCCTPYQIYVVNGISNNAQKQEIKTISFYLASHVPFIIYRNNMQTIIIKLKSVCNYYHRTETKL